jgi:hypothetical protein
MIFIDKQSPLVNALDAKRHFGGRLQCINGLSLGA